MLDSLLSKIRQRGRGGAAHFRFQIRVLQVWSWPSSKFSKDMILQWKRGDRHSGMTKRTLPSHEGMVIFDESFELPVTLYYKNSGTGLSPFQEKALIFTLLDAENAMGLPLAHATLDLASYVHMNGSQSIHIPLVLPKYVPVEPMLAIAIKADAEQITCFAQGFHYKDRTSAWVLPWRSSTSSSSLDDQTQKSLVAALLNEDEEEEGKEGDFEIASFTDDESMDESDKQATNAGGTTKTALCQAPIIRDASNSGYINKSGDINGEKVIYIQTKDVSSSNIGGLSLDTVCEEDAIPECSNNAEGEIMESSPAKLEGPHDYKIYRSSSYNVDIGCLDDENDGEMTSEEVAGSVLEEARQKFAQGADKRNKIIEKQAYEEAKIKLAEAELKHALVEGQRRQLELCIGMLTEDLQVAALIEAVIYNANTEHGSVSLNLLSPARFLSLLYSHASVHWSSEKRASFMANLMTGLFLASKACGPDVARLSTITLHVEGFVIPCARMFNSLMAPL